MAWFSCVVVCVFVCYTLSTCDVFKSWCRVFRGMFYHTLAAAPDKLGLKGTVTYTIMPEGDDEA